MPHVMQKTPSLCAISDHYINYLQPKWERCWIAKLDSHRVGHFRGFWHDRVGQTWRLKLS